MCHSAGTTVSNKSCWAWTYVDSVEHYFFHAVGNLGEAIWGTNIRILQRERSFLPAKGEVLGRSKGRKVSAGTTQWAEWNACVVSPTVDRWQLKRNKWAAGWKIWRWGHFNMFWIWCLCRTNPVWMAPVYRMRTLNPVQGDSQLMMKIPPTIQPHKW